jgi:hypothetical protein
MGFGSNLTRTTIEDNYGLMFTGFTCIYSFSTTYYILLLNSEKIQFPE